MPPGTNERPFPGMPTKAAGRAVSPSTTPHRMPAVLTVTPSQAPSETPTPAKGPSSPRLAHVAPLVLTRADVQHLFDRFLARRNEHAS